MTAALTAAAFAALFPVAVMFVPLLLAIFERKLLSPAGGPDAGSAAEVDKAQELS